MAEKRLFSRRGLVISLAIVALVVSLASRVVHFSFDQHPTAHSNAITAKIQHRDKDASGWVPPAGGFSLLWVASPSAASEPHEKIYVRLQYDSLYNRPPPAA